MPTTAPHHPPPDHQFTPPPLTEPPAEWQTMALADMQRQPVNVRWAIWMAYGAALLLPVDALFGAINQQCDVAKRTLNGKRLRWTDAERLLHLTHIRQLPRHIRNLIHWIVSPAAIIRFVKRFQQRRANSAPDDAAPKKPGRPGIGAEKVNAILRIYDTGCTGLRRIVGEMAKCGLPVAKSTVRRVLTAHGRPPTDSSHRQGSTWAQFWKLHAKHLVGIDFLQVPIGVFGRVVNAFILWGIEHDTRRVHLLGITTNPTDTWIAQTIRNATMDDAPLANRRYWILDNDGKYGPEVRRLLGKRLVLTCPYTPDMNAFIERFHRSIQDECLNHVILLSEHHLRHIVTSYLRHYHDQRPHQGIGNVTIGTWSVGTGDIVCDESLHGLLKSFRRAA